MMYATLHNNGGTPTLILAQAASDPGATAAPRATTTQKAASGDRAGGSTSGAGSYQPGGGFPSLRVSPDVNALPGLKKANEGVDGLAAATLIVLLITGVIGVLTLAASNFMQLPRWAEQGKLGVIIAPLGAFVLALLGQLIGWGWSLGIG